VSVHACACQIHQVAGYATTRLSNVVESGSQTTIRES
jgi:hypothetical protein